MHLCIWRDESYDDDHDDSYYISDIKSMETTHICIGYISLSDICSKVVYSIPRLSLPHPSWFPSVVLTYFSPPCFYVVYGCSGREKGNFHSFPLPLSEMQWFSTFSHFRQPYFSPWHMERNGILSPFLSCNVTYAYTYSITRELWIISISTLTRMACWKDVHFQTGKIPKQRKESRHDRGW